MRKSTKRILKVETPRRHSDLLRRHLTLHDGSAPSDSKRVRACDACHASKIRCDGGVRCSLCTKRGIDCAFTRGPAALNGNVAANPPQGSASSLHSDHGSRSPDPPRAAPTDASASTSGSQPDTNHAVPMSYTMNGTAPVSQGTQQQDAPSIAIEGLQLVLEAVSRPRSSGSSRLQRPPTPEVKKWSASCIKSYMGRFHDRWPVLHAPTFEHEVDSVTLRSTAIIIGFWLQNETEDNSLAFDIHSILVKRLLDELVSSCTLDYWNGNACV